MGLYQYLRNIYKQPKESLKSIWQQRLIEWRRTNSIVRIEKPTRLDRAHALGYKAKKGYIVVRIRLNRGGRKRLSTKQGRKTKQQRRRKILEKSYQWVAEERVNRKYKNCEIIGSYFVAKDGKHYWFEVILLDRNYADQYNVSQGHKGKSFRGLTASGKRSRGILTNKGKGAEKLRPSLRAHRRRGK